MFWISLSGEPGAAVKQQEKKKKAEAQPAAKAVVEFLPSIATEASKPTVTETEAVICLHRKVDPQT